jgi:hypothetical protein
MNGLSDGITTGANQMSDDENKAADLKQFKRHRVMAAHNKAYQQLTEIVCSVG